jgi:hypothetical protein
MIPCLFLIILLARRKIFLLESAGLSTYMIKWDPLRVLFLQWVIHEMTTALLYSSVIQVTGLFPTVLNGVFLWCFLYGYCFNIRVPWLKNCLFLSLFLFNFLISQLSFLDTMMICCHCKWSVNGKQCFKNYFFPPKTHTTKLLESIKIKQPLQSRMTTRITKCNTIYLLCGLWLIWHALNWMLRVCFSIWGTGDIL